MTSKATEATEELAEATPEPVDIDIRANIRSIYLYYITYSDSEYSVKIYEYFDPDKEITNPEGEITTLILNAYEGNTKPPCYCEDPKYLMMRRKSYVAFALIGVKDVIVNGDILFSGRDPYNNPSDGTHSFFYEDDFKVVIAGSNETINVVYCMNTMQSTRNKNLGDREWEEFGIELPFTSRAEGFRQPGTGGTNMGPPVPPPERLVADMADPEPGLPS